jgi:hypothetical protein
MTPRHALAGLMLLAGCNSAPPVHLAPIPAPPPVIVKVPQLVPLPEDATTPCSKPQARPIRTDVDLLRAADAMKVWGQCNQNKLQAIKEAQP